MEAVKEARPDFLTVTEVAEEFRVNRFTIYRWIKEGGIKAIRLGQAFRIPVEEIERIKAEGVPTERFTS